MSRTLSTSSFDTLNTDTGNYYKATAGKNGDGGSRSSSRRSHTSRKDCTGGGGGHDSHHDDDDVDDDPAAHGAAAAAHSKHQHVPSLNYQNDESIVWRAHAALDHFHHRGAWWNTGKHEESMRYVYTALIGIVQGCVAYGVNMISAYLIDAKFEHVYSALEQGHVWWAFTRYALTQLIYAMWASAMVYAVPISAGSGIPEVKCYLNGIDLPNVGAPMTLVAKCLGVIGSVAAGLPVGKEGPMVHSGAVVATTITSGKTRNDEQVRDYVTCGAAAGVCTAFSAPIGGILFALEEGASYWGHGLTWRTFFCSMVAFTTLLVLNTIGSALGKVGYNRLFSFGNFLWAGEDTSFAVFELVIFVALGVLGGLVGAIFNHTNEQITLWRRKHINRSPLRRFLEVCALSLCISTVSFMLPALWPYCTPLPQPNSTMSPQEVQLLRGLVPFRCEPNEQYNELASLYLTEPGVAIRQLFHLHHHTFSDAALLLFLVPYIFMAVVVYGIAVPSGLFVPSLLSGAALGRLLGNLANKVAPTGYLAFSNTYALIGAAAVLGGMARMTISLTVILLECTGNEQFVLPLMLTLMTARITGGFFNDDLYHIHIHMKKGVSFLENELKKSPHHHDLTAHDVMGDELVYVRPVDNVGTVLDILQTTTMSAFPVVDVNDKGVLVGTIGRNELCVLLKQRAFGQPKKTSSERDPTNPSVRILHNYFEWDGERYIPLVDWKTLEGSYPRYPSANEIRVGSRDRECFLDLRPYMNMAPISVQEETSVGRTYDIFRTLGLKMLPVVNRHNQCVGTITRTDICNDNLALTLLQGGQNKKEL